MLYDHINNYKLSYNHYNIYIFIVTRVLFLTIIYENIIMH